MARAVRIEREGGWYHITARGNERRAIYWDHRDRMYFCELLARMVRAHLDTPERGRSPSAARGVARRGAGDPESICLAERCE